MRGSSNMSMTSAAAQAAERGRRYLGRLSLRRRGRSTVSESSIAERLSKIQEVWGEGVARTGDRDLSDEHALQEERHDYLASTRLDLRRLESIDGWLPTCTLTILDEDMHLGIRCGGRGEGGIE